MATLGQIQNATDTYVQMLHNYNISLILKDIVSKKYLNKDVHVFEYPGNLDITEETQIKNILNKRIEFTDDSGKKYFKILKTVFKPNLQKKYNMGILSVALDSEDSEDSEGPAHYISFILDNSTNSVYLWDSALTNSVEEFQETTKIIKSLYPRYELKGINICSGCGAYQPGAGAGDEEGTYETQNIFCHTWSIWFLNEILIGLMSSISIEDKINEINNQCKTLKENLITIKLFAHKYLICKILHEEEIPNFNYIWNPETERSEKIFNL